MELNFLGALHLRLCVFARVFFTYTKFVLRTTKVPHLLKGRVRDDILEVDWNLIVAGARVPRVLFQIS